jgi:hypothetical protein
MTWRRLPLIATFTVASLTGVASFAEAFGAPGHQIVCEIAFQRLTPAARTFVQAIRADRTEIRDPFAACGAVCAGDHPDDGRDMSFSQGCVWPDEARFDTYKDTYDQHFINISNVFTTFDLARDCADLDCALVGIQRFARYVATRPSGQRERERRVLALRFLGHIVGDLHQPLHVAFAEDLGGNLLQVRWRTGNGDETTNTNLHSVWDGEIMRRAGLTNDPRTVAATLNAQITSAQALSWGTLDLKAWASESFAASQTTAYRKPDGSRVQPNEMLSDAYFNAAWPVVEIQLKKAGVRLAAILNAAAAGTLPVRLITLSAP